MKQQLLIILTTSVLLGCSTNEGSPIKNQAESAIIKSEKSDMQSDVITEPCAIIISPTNKQIDSLQKAYGDDFYTMADDNLFYTAFARVKLDSLKIPTIERKSMGTITFRQKNGKITTKNLHDFAWGILLFNTHEEPITADITNIESEIKRCFAK
jgi:hypothetical protein